MKTLGIDISKYQANMDLARAKNEGVRFTIIRGAYGRSKDTAFESNYKKAKANGLGVGVYWWTRATSEATAKAEATFLINNVLKGKQFEYPIYIDVEDKLLAGLGKSKVDAIIRSACETLENAGYYAGFYMNADWFKNKCNGSSLAKRFTCWIARWCRQEQNGYPMWQFGGETNYIRSNKIAGQVCDQDYCYTDFPSIIKQAGKNGYAKGTIDNGTQTINNNVPVSQPTPTQQPKSGFLPSKGYFKYGDVSNNIGKVADFMYKNFPAYTPKAILSSKNHFGPSMLSTIKNFQKRTGLVVDGYLGRKTYEKLKSFGFKG